MPSETDATRLAEIGARCERAAEGPWALGGRHVCSSILSPDGEPIVGCGFGDYGILCRANADFIAHAREDVPWLLEFAERLETDGGGVRDTVALKDPDGIVFEAEVPAGDGPRVQEKLDKLVHAYEQEPELLKLLRKTGAAWQATESRLIRICQLLGVDYTCEEPETCEQVIERMKADIRELKGKLDIIVREGTDESPDSLAADYGGTGWEKSKEVVAVRTERGKAVKAAGRLTAMREALEVLSGWASKAIQALCDVDNMNLRAIGLRFNADAREALASDAGKPEADVIAAAKRFEDADKQFMELNRDNPWYNQCGFILLEDRAEAKKDLCDAVKRLRKESGGDARGAGEGRRVVSAKITKHGLRWYFNGEVPKCPECDSENVDWTRSSDGKTPDVWCKDCGCKWTQTRTRDGGGK